MQPEVLEIHEVDVGPFARLQRAAVIESVDRCGAPGLQMHGLLERDEFATVAVANPVCEQCRGHAHITDQSAVCSTVAESKDRIRVQHHLAHGIEVVVLVTRERREQKCCAVTFEHPVECNFLRAATLACGHSSDAGFGGGLVVGRVAKREDARPA